MHQRASAASGAQEIDKKIEDLRVKNRRRREVLARGRSARKNKKSRADDCADAERRQRPRPERLAQAVLGLVGLSNQFVDGLSAQELVF
jgi:hypothetical protein